MRRMSRIAVLAAIGYGLAASPGSAGPIDVPIPKPPPGCKFVSTTVDPGKSAYGVKCTNTYGGNGCSCTAVRCTEQPYMRNAKCVALPH